MQDFQDSHRHHAIFWTWLRLPRLLLHTRTSGQKGPRSWWCLLQGNGLTLLPMAVIKPKLPLSAAASEERPPPAWTPATFQSLESSGAQRREASIARPLSCSTLALPTPGSKPSCTGQELLPRPERHAVSVLQAAAPRPCPSSPPGAPRARPAAAQPRAAGTPAPGCAWHRLTRRILDRMDLAGEPNDRELIIASSLIKCLK